MLRFSLEIFLIVICVLGQIRNSQCKYSEKETKSLEKLRKIIQDAELNLDYMKTDAYLIAWLRKHDYDVEKTAVKIRTALQWRKENQVDSVLEEDFSVFAKNYPLELDGVDKAGRPVWFVQIGKWDIRRIVISGLTKQYQRYTIYMYEKIAQKIRELNEKSVGKNITEYLLVADLAGYNLRQHACIRCIPITLEFELIAAEAYAEVPYKAIMVNTPTIFYQVFETFKPLIPEGMLRTYEIYDFDREIWGKVLEEYIELDQIPQQFQRGGGGGEKKKSN